MDWYVNKTPKTEPSLELIQLPTASSTPKLDINTEITQDIKHDTKTEITEIDSE